MTQIAQTPPQADNKIGAYFDKTSFDALVYQKGLQIIHETALQCPCKSDDTNQLSNCKNCGGSGWLFVNPTETRCVIQSLNAVTEFKDWSEKVRGMVKITGLDTDQYSTMDRLTILKANSIHNEVIHLSKKDAAFFGYTTYNIKKPIVCARFEDPTSALVQLTMGIHYTIDRNLIKISDNTLNGRDRLQITFRYFHAPQYHVIEMSRETMDQWKDQNSGKQIYLPVHGMAQRTHYHLDQENIVKNRLIENGFTFEK